MKPTPPHLQKFTPVARLLHWSMGILWLAVWIIGYLAVNWRDLLNPHHGLTIAHKALAAVLLFLIVIRVFWRLTHRAPALPDSMSPLMQRAAHWGHFLLYAIALIALPFSGWMWSSLADKPIMVLWLFQLPPLVDPNPAYYPIAKQVHITLAWFTGALVLGHILIAFKHYFIDRDGIMESMLPHGEKRSAQEQKSGEK